MIPSRFMCVLKFMPITHQQNRVARKVRSASQKVFPRASTSRVSGMLINCESTQQQPADKSTWNDDVNAATIPYTCSQSWPGSGLNGVRIYCSPSSGTSNSVALKRRRRHRHRHKHSRRHLRILVTILGLMGFVTNTHTLPVRHKAKAQACVRSQFTRFRCVIVFAAVAPKLTEMLGECCAMGRPRPADPAVLSASATGRARCCTETTGLRASTGKRAR